MRRALGNSVEMYVGREREQQVEIGESAMHQIETERSYVSARHYDITNLGFRFQYSHYEHSMHNRSGHTLIREQRADCVRAYELNEQSHRGARTP